MRPTFPTNYSVHSITNAANGAAYEISPTDWKLTIGTPAAAPAAATVITLPPNPVPGEFYVIADPFGRVGAAHTIQVNGGGINIATGTTTVTVTQTGALSAPNGWGCVEFTYDEEVNVWISCNLPTT